MKTNKIAFIIGDYKVNLVGTDISFERLVDRDEKQNSLTKDDLVQEVVAAVKHVITEKENRQYRKLSFAFQAQVGNQLKNSGIILPKPLSEYLSDYPETFRIGTHPYTKAATVSIR